MKQEIKDGAAPVEATSAGAVRNSDPGFRDLVPGEIITPTDETWSCGEGPWERSYGSTGEPYDTNIHWPHRRRLWDDPTPAPSPEPAEAAPAGGELIAELVAALRQIADSESNHCNRCDGGGQVWADGKAHSQGYSGPMMACSDCGGAGETDSEDLREIARAALTKAQGSR